MLFSYPLYNSLNYVVSVYFCSVPYPLKNNYYYYYLFFYIILA